MPTPPPAPKQYPDAAREMLRAARENLEAHQRGLSYLIITAREQHGLPWADIAQATGLSELTCRRRAANYLEEREGVA